MNYVIIGAGPAGVVAAETLRRLDDHRDMLRRGVVDDDPGRKELESVLRRRLGTFPTTAIDRLVHHFVIGLSNACQREPTILPVEQNRIEIVFKLAHLLTDGGLGNHKFLRGDRKT